MKQREREREREREMGDHWLFILWGTSPVFASLLEVSNLLVSVSGLEDSTSVESPKPLATTKVLLTVAYSMSC